MPEGDTVWLAARSMNAALGGQALLRSDFRVPALAEVDLAGRTVLEVVARGKHLLTRISPPPDKPDGSGVTLHTHFRMDGSWHLYRPGERWRGPDFQVRVVLVTSAWQAVGFRLPVVELLPTAEEARAVGHLGPDVLGADWDPGLALGRLLADPQREVGQALLDQRVLAGVGNLYKTEVLYLRGVTPWTTVGDVSDPAAVVDLCHRLLYANRDRVEQVTTGDRRPGRTHWVFERHGRPCLRCGTRILMAEQGDPPYQRLSSWCPRCQKGPAPAGMSRSDLPPPPKGRARYRP